MTTHNDPAWPSAYEMARLLMSKTAEAIGELVRHIDYLAPQLADEEPFITSTGSDSVTVVRHPKLLDLDAARYRLSIAEREHAGALRLTMQSNSDDRSPNWLIQKARQWTVYDPRNDRP